MSIPQFTAEASLDALPGFVPAYGSVLDGAVPQACPPMGVCMKASRYCQNPEAGGMWCDILSRCADCYWS